MKAKLANSVYIQDQPSELWRVGLLVTPGQERSRSFNFVV
jgi:hypothetical protein